MMHERKQEKPQPSLELGALEAYPSVWPEHCGAERLRHLWATANHCRTSEDKVGPEALPLRIPSLTGLRPICGASLINGVLLLWTVIIAGRSRLCVSLSPKGHPRLSAHIRRSQQTPP